MLCISMHFKITSLLSFLLDQFLKVRTNHIISTGVLLKNIDRFFSLNFNVITKVLWELRACVLSCVQLFATPQTVIASQAPVSRQKFPRQKYWSKLSFPPPGILPDRSNLGLMQETQETWVRSLGQKDPLEKEIATHSNILVWKIP